MKTLLTFWRWLRSLGQRRAVKQDIDEELRLHLEMRTAENIAAGMAPEEAAREARRRFGNVQSIREKCREVRGASFGETTWQDVRFGLRMLLKNPGFAVVGVLTLALGIGVNTAIFSLVNAVMLRPPPFPQHGRLVFLSEKSQHMDDMSISYPNLLDWQEQNQVFAGVAGFRGEGFNLTGKERPERVEGYAVSASFFSVMRVAPLQGRVFSPDEDKPGASKVVVLSEGLWQRRFGSDASILNQPISLNGGSYTVIGIMPRAFQFPRTVELWTPLGLNYAQENWKQRGNHPGIYAIARMKPSITLEQATAEMQTIAARLAQQYPDSNTGNSVTIMSLRERMVRQARPALLLLLGSVLFVLLIACANLANLLLARSAARQKEFAIRAALGAGKFRIARQLLSESLVLSLLGGMFGLLLASWGIQLLNQIIPAEIREAIVINLDGKVLAFTLGVALLSGIAFGLAPALQAARPNLTESLKEGGLGTGEGRSRHRFRKALVVSEISAALVLLIGACLLIRSFGRVQAVSPGIDTENVSVMYFSLPQYRYREEHQQQTFFDELIRRTAALPGVNAASITTTPLGHWQTGYEVHGQPKPPPGRGHLCDIATVSPDYFKVMGIPLRRGRGFSDADNERGQKVVIIDEKFANKFWPDADPLGQQIQLGGDTNELLSIVGVVGHVKNYGVDAASREEIYLPVKQHSQAAMNLMIKTARSMPELAATLRGVVLAMDPDQPLTSLRTMESILGESTAPRRITMLLLSVFSGLAVALAVVGIYGVMAYSISQRTREIGVRMALGARAQDVLKLMLKQGGQLIVIGVLLGSAVALGLTRFMGRLLFEVEPTDPLTYLTMPLLLAAVALLACYIPARRAAKVDPMVALRYE
ncbi:MAG: ABC transporter permease [Verrucomicrobia bacterium]|nr:ABC transporter permease [Verrucomicrobiota bacterium]